MREVDAAIQRQRRAVSGPSNFPAPSPTSQMNVGDDDNITADVDDDAKVIGEFSFDGLDLDTKTIADSDVSYDADADDDDDDTDDSDGGATLEHVEDISAPSGSSVSSRPSTEHVEDTSAPSGSSGSSQPR